MKYALGGLFVVMALLLGTANQASAADCSPPTGPGDNLVHSGGINIKHAGCDTARTVVIRCARFSGGNHGYCNAAGEKWYCRSTSFPGSKERCVSGRKVIRWTWID